MPSQFPPGSGSLNLSTGELGLDQSVYLSFYLVYSNQVEADKTNENEIRIRIDLDGTINFYMNRETQFENTYIIDENTRKLIFELAEKLIFSPEFYDSEMMEKKYSLRLSLRTSHANFERSDIEVSTVNNMGESYAQFVNLLFENIHHEDLNSIVPELLDNSVVRHDGANLSAEKGFDDINIFYFSVEVPFDAIRDGLGEDISVQNYINAHIDSFDDTITIDLWFWRNVKYGNLQRDFSLLVLPSARNIFPDHVDVHANRYYSFLVDGELSESLVRSFGNYFTDFSRTNLKRSISNLNLNISVGYAIGNVDIRHNIKQLSGVEILDSNLGELFTSVYAALPNFHKNIFNASGLFVEEPVIYSLKYGFCEIHGAGFIVGDRFDYTNLTFEMFESLRDKLTIEYPNYNLAFPGAPSFDNDFKPISLFCPVCRDGVDSHFR